MVGSNMLLFFPFLMILLMMILSFFIIKSGLKPKNYDGNINEFRIATDYHNIQIKDKQGLLKHIRIQAWKAFIYPFCILFLYLIITFSQYSINFYNRDGQIFLVVFLLFYILIDIICIKSIYRKYNNLFQRYGGIENVLSIINEITSTTEIVIGSMIISKRYIMEENHFDKIVQYDDVLNVFISKGRYNSLRISIIARNNRYCYHFWPRYYKYLPNLVKYLREKCKNVNLDNSLYET